MTDHGRLLTPTHNHNRVGRGSEYGAEWGSWHEQVFGEGEVGLTIDQPVSEWQVDKFAVGADSSAMACIAGPDFWGRYATHRG